MRNSSKYEGKSSLCFDKHLRDSSIYSNKSDWSSHRSLNIKRSRGNFTKQVSLKDESISYILESRLNHNRNRSSSLNEIKATLEERIKQK